MLIAMAVFLPYMVDRCFGTSEASAAQVDAMLASGMSKQLGGTAR